MPFPPSKPAKPIEQPAAATNPAPAYQLASATSEPAFTPAAYEIASGAAQSVETLRAATLIARASITDTTVSSNHIINERGYWQGLPSVEATEAPPMSAQHATPAPTARRAIASAAAAPWPLAERTDSEPVANALAYAAQPNPIAVARTLPVGGGTARPTIDLPAETTVAVKRSDDSSLVAPPRAKGVVVVRVGDRFNDPWMRAMIVSPSAQSFMKTTVYGVPDFRALGAYLHKPAATMMATFSDDPYRGMSSEMFSGSAVGFTRTVTFSPPRTASLR